LFVDAATKEEATEKVDAACKKLLSNQIMESYTFDLVEA
jgi:phosphoribosylformylglycinamidine (FGAM) synthase PurS component